jgi:hypothetical protein
MERKKGTSYKTASPFRRSLLASATNLAELAPKLDSLGIVDVEHGHRGSADGGSPDKDESHPFKVALFGTVYATPAFTVSDSRLALRYSRQGRQRHDEREVGREIIDRLLVSRD